MAPAITRTPWPPTSGPHRWDAGGARRATSLRRPRVLACQLLARRLIGWRRLLRFWVPKAAGGGPRTGKARAGLGEEARARERAHPHWPMARTAAALLLAALAALAATPRTAARAERDAAVWPNRWTGSNRHGAYRPVWDAEKATWPDVRRTKDDRGLQGVCLGARHAAAFRQCSSTHVFVGVLSAAANAERFLR